MKKGIIAAVIIIVVIIGSIFIFRNQPTTPDQPIDQTITTGGTDNDGTTADTGGNPAATTTGTTSGTPGTYTLADVAAHNSGASCWTTINGSVYDVTTWINQHPGGPDAILSLCGKDGSDAFNGQHGGQARPASELATFKIGTLAR